MTYTALKGGVAQLTKALANGWAEHGVNVNAMAPGYVRTQLSEHVWDDPNHNAEIVGPIYRRHVQPGGRARFRMAISLRLRGAASCPTNELDSVRP